MEHQLFFVVGDLVANVVIGIIVALIAWVLVTPDWNMWVGMLVMMPIGMIAGLLFFFPVGIKLGAMEAMVPLMLSGELSGMVAGMTCAMTLLSAVDAMLLGAAVGLIGILFVWTANALLSGPTREADGA